jgi:hypothetical protein
MAARQRRMLVEERKTLLLDPILARALDPSQIFFSSDGGLV